MFVVAKENPKTPCGWVFFKCFEDKYPMNTYFPDDAMTFDSKEAAALHYWEVCKVLRGYKIYPFTIFSEGKEICH